MNEKWKSRFLVVMAREDSCQEQAFLSLVDQVDGRCSLDVARILMKSFAAKPDYGTQERVVSVLASATKENTLTAILEELPRLVKEAPEWAEVLVGQEVDRRPSLLADIARRCRPEVVTVLREVLSEGSFQDFYPNVKTIML